MIRIMFHKRSMTYSNIRAALVYLFWILFDVELCSDALKLDKTKMLKELHSHSLYLYHSFFFSIILILFHFVKDICQKKKK